MTVEISTWQQRANDAQERREKQLPDEYRIPKEKMPADSVKDVSNFPRESGLFTEDELQITEVSAPVLLKQVEEKKWTAEQVARAYCKRAAYAQQLLNCLSEMRFELAIAEAKELDEYYEMEGKLKGPLHGLPISIKDNHLLKGTTSAVGFTKWSTTIWEEDSVIAQLVVRMGAVIYCKTSVPLAMMSVETETRLLGLTTNPKNRSHGVGGSSGGEGALSAFGGSPVGFGSDIGGSIRIPSNYNGLYGLKGTSGRIPTAGTLGGLAGQFHVKSIAGPMSRSLESVELLAKLLYNSNPELLDENCVPMPWREPVLSKKLVFGVLRSDKYCRPTPAVTRAIEKAVEAVKAQGHDVVEWEPIAHDKIDKMMLAFFTADGGAFIREALDDEPLLEHQIVGADKIKEIPSSTIWAVQRERVKIEKGVLAQWNNSCKWSQSGQVMDGLIAPVTAVPAYPHRKANYVGYTNYWNLLDYPSVAFPVLRADASIDGKPDLEYISDAEKRLWDDFDPVACDGGCVGLQIITRRYEDEKALKLAGVIAKALQKV
jgi:amidase